VRTRPSHFAAAPKKHAAFACPLPPTIATRSRSGSKLPPKHTPTPQHSQGSHSAQNALRDGHRTMANFPIIQNEMLFAFYFMQLQEGMKARAHSKVSSISTVLYWPEDFQGKALV